MDIVCNFTECSTGSIQASNKVARWLSGQMNCLLIDTKQKAQFTIDNNIQIKRLFLVSGIALYCNFLNELYELVKRAEKVIYVCNDYMVKIPSQVKKIRNGEIIYVMNHQQKDKVWDYYLDVNKLLSKQGGEPKPYEIDGLFYFGAFRKNRIKSFQTYLQPSQLRVSISTTSLKNMDKFQELSKKAELYKFEGDIMNVMPRFQSTIYIEDQSKNILHSPANRFYESISSKILVFYDRGCKSTLERAGYWDDDFAVSSQQEVIEKLMNYETLREKQIKQFEARNFKDELNSELKLIIDKI